MSSEIPFSRMAPGVGWLRFWLPLLALLLCGRAHADPYQDINIRNCGTPPAPRNCPTDNLCGDPTMVRCYAAPQGQPVLSDATIGIVPFATGDVCSTNPLTTLTWGFTPGANCTANNACNGMNIMFPSSAATTGRVMIKGVPTASVDSCFTLGVVANCGGGNILTCSATYRLVSTGMGHGWGEPHILKVDGPPTYDFQGAGEFTALRGKEFERGEEFERGKEFELQTRQTPFPSAFTPTDPYTGLSSCLSIYTAVAARVGKHRVSYQPNISGDPDPSGMQLRVDGVVTKLGPEGINLDGDHDEASPTRGAIVERRRAGRIVQSPIGGGFEIDYADGTKLVVTPPSPWINVTVYLTSATKGIMGLTKDAWLPALPDGASLGPKPAAPHDRYVQLYEKFANAWRVTDETSLFDYAPGTSTETFTNRKYPGENPSSCAIEGQPTAQPIDVHVAEKHCSAVVDKNNKANCIFDVSVTGNPGVAKTYEISEQLDPGLTRTTVKDDSELTNYGENVSFTATVQPTLPRGTGAPGGTVQFVLDGSNAGDPVALDSNGRAVWSTSSLQAGKHQIVASYIPSGFGGSIFLASTSPEEIHTVITPEQYFWLIVLLGIIILIGLIVLGYRLARS